MKTPLGLLAVRPLPPPAPKRLVFRLEAAAYGTISNGLRCASARRASAAAEGTGTRRGTSSSRNSGSSRQQQEARSTTTSIAASPSFPPLSFLLMQNSSVYCCHVPPMLHVPSSVALLPSFCRSFLLHVSVYIRDDIRFGPQKGAYSQLTRLGQFISARARAQASLVRAIFSLKNSSKALDMRSGGPPSMIFLSGSPWLNKQDKRRGRERLT